jgi:hypothetical protein
MNARMKFSTSLFPRLPGRHSRSSRPGLQHMFIASTFCVRPQHDNLLLLYLTLSHQSSSSNSHRRTSALTRPKRLPSTKLSSLRPSSDRTIALPGDISGHNFSIRHFRPCWTDLPLLSCASTIILIDLAQSTASPTYFLDIAKRIPENCSKETYNR